MPLLVSTVMNYNTTFETKYYVAFAGIMIGVIVAFLILAGGLLRRKFRGGSNDRELVDTAVDMTETKNALAK